jgi:hypothetical protein
MTDDKNQFSGASEQPTDQKPAPTYIPASPQKRIWAWVGVVYMVMIVLLFTYSISHGVNLQGIAGLMLAPAIAGVAATSIYNIRAGQSRYGLAGLLLLLLLCVMGFVACLMQGVPGLISYITGA